MGEEYEKLREEIRGVESRLENKIKEIRVRSEEREVFWRERVAYISTIVALVVALVMIVVI